MKVWVITTGQYSDYTVAGVATTPELAKQISDRLHDANEPLEFEVLTEIPHNLMVDTWDVEMDLYSGNRAKAWENRPYTIDEPPATMSEYVTYKVPERDGGNERTYVTRVHAHSAEQAIKAANEKRAAFLAEAVTVAGAADAFWRSQSLAELATAQGVRPIASPAELYATFWPEDDEEDFLAAVRRWRQEP